MQNLQFTRLKVTQGEKKKSHSRVPHTDQISICFGIREMFARRDMRDHQA